MSDISPEKLSELQAEITALCDKHGVELRASQKLEISVFPKPEEVKEDPKVGDIIEDEEKKDA